LLPGFGHVSCVPNSPVFADGEDTFFAVRAKNEGKNLRDWVVKFPTGIGSFERTIGARAKLLINIACSDFAPVFSLNLFATWALPGDVFSARSAI